MQFTTTTRDYTTKDTKGNKATIKAITHLVMDVASHPAGKERKEEAEALEVRAAIVLAELAKLHGVDTTEAPIKALRNAFEVGLFTPAQEESYGSALAMLVKASKFRTVTLSGTTLNLALQGIGPNAHFITSAVRKAVRGFLLLDSIAD
jgi:hypothetical protein